MIRLQCLVIGLLLILLSTAVSADLRDVYVSTATASPAWYQVLPLELPTPGSLLGLTGRREEQPI